MTVASWHMCRSNYNTANARLSVPWVQHRSRRRPRRRPPSPPPHTKNTHSIETFKESNASEFARIITTPVHVSRHIPLLTVAAHPGWEENETTLQKSGQHTDSKSRTKPKHTPSCYRRNPDRSASSEKLAAEFCHKFNTRLRQSAHSRQRKITWEEKGISEPPHTALLSVEILPRADCKHHSQTSSARSSPQCAHLPHRRRDGHSRHPTTFHQTKGNGKWAKTFGFTTHSLQMVLPSSGQSRRWEEVR